MLTEKRQRELSSFLKANDLKFSDLRLLNLAFTHTSYSNECRSASDNNERLEFLGDSVLGMITAEYLFSSFTRFHEGEFSKIKALADCMEAVIAALYLDQGLEAARRFVLSFIPGQVEKFLENKLSYKDYKTELQEYLQKRRGKVPKYVLVSQTGPDHDQVFSVTVELGTKVYGPAEGRNKKSAEQAAARMALIAIGLEKG